MVVHVCDFRRVKYGGRKYLALASSQASGWHSLQRHLCHCSHLKYSRCYGTLVFLYFIFLTLNWGGDLQGNYYSFSRYLL